MSKIIILVFSFILLNAESFNFTELRYSDALGKSMKFHGEISFFEDGLYINYKEANKSLRLKDTDVIYKEDSKEVALGESQSQNIAQYLEMIFLLHSGDEELLQSMFDLETSAELTLLKPKGSAGHYIIKIELLKDEEKIKNIKLFLNNSDEISINIDDEIR